MPETRSQWKCVDNITRQKHDIWNDGTAYGAWHLMYMNLCRDCCKIDIGVARGSVDDGMASYGHERIKEPTGYRVYVDMAMRHRHAVIRAVSKRQREKGIREYVDSEI